MSIMANSYRITNLSRLVHALDADYERDKRLEWEFDFRGESGRIFKGNTAKRGPYESPLTGFLNGSYSGVTSLPGD